MDPIRLLQIYYAPDDGAVGTENFNRYGYEGKDNSLQNYPDASVEGGEEEELIILNPDDQELSDEEQAELEKQQKETESQKKSDESDSEYAERLRQEMQQTQQNITQNLKEGFGSISESLQKSFQQQNRPANDPQDNPEKFKEEIEKGLFEDGKTYDTFMKGVNQAVGPYLNEMQKTLVNQEREILSVQDETKENFRKYRKEIDDTVASLPRNQQLTPGVYKWAYQQTMARHVDDLKSEAAQQSLKSTLEKIGYTLDENGEPVPKKEGKSGDSSTYSAPSNSGGMGTQHSGEGQPKRKTKKVRATQEDIDAARKLGVTLQDYYDYWK